MERSKYFERRELRIQNPFTYRACGRVRVGVCPRTESLVHNEGTCIHGGCFEVASSRHTNTSHK